MTILPTKKSSQSKSEGDGSDPSSFHGDRHGHSGHSAEQYNFANRNSPPRWAAPNASSRDEKRPAHATASGFDEFDAVDSGPSHSKRRHRASPHRSLRKVHHRASGVNNFAAKPSTSQGANSPAVEDAASARDDADPSGYNSGDEYDKPPELWTTEEFKEREYHFEKKLRKKGLTIKNMGEDGACLFRAVADQVYGDQEMHKAVRKLCMDYMAKNSDYYSQYVTEDFDKYLERKRCDHIHGNHIEMQALSEMFNRPIEVYHYSSEPINIFHAGGHPQQTDNEPIRLSYHRNVHYNSIVDPYKATVGVGLGLPAFKPGLADKALVKEALRASEELQLEQAMLEDKLRATDWEATSEALEEQVARESYLHWLRENEMRSRKKTRSATATSSSSLSPLVDGTGNNTTNSAAACGGGASTSPRGGRSSPRSRASPRTPPHGAGAQSPPHQCDSGNLHAAMDNKGFSPKAGSSGLSVIPDSEDNTQQQPQPSGLSMSPLSQEEGFSLVETASFLNHLPPSMFGLTDWEDTDIIARVLAQSQQEYLDSLKRAAPGACSPARDGSYSDGSSVPAASGSSSSSANAASLSS